MASDALPDNSLELNLMLTNSTWGEELPEELKKQILSVRKKLIPKGTLIQQNDGFISPLSENAYKTEQVDTWEMLKVLKRDLRLGNLDRQLFNECNHYLDWAIDCLREGYPAAAMAGIGRVASRIDLSQSKGGWLRKLQQTFIKEERSRNELSQQQNSIFAGKTKR